jgi:hypothetical protein
VTNVITTRGEAMRKFLMVAAVVAVAACGEKKAEGTDTSAMAAPAAAPTAPAATADSMAATHDTMVAKHDSMVAKKDSMAPAPKKP